MVWWVLGLVVVMKALTTGLTLMAGGSAGLLVPAMYMGGMTGAMMFLLLQSLGIYMPPDAITLFVITGIASGLVAIVEVPIATIAFVIELFGASFGPVAILSVVICYHFSRRWELYLTRK